MIWEVSGAGRIQAGGQETLSLVMVEAVGPVVEDYVGRGKGDGQGHSRGGRGTVKSEKGLRGKDWC